MKTFLGHQHFPVCLAAHNNLYDFRSIQAEHVKTDVVLGMNMLCMDSNVGNKKTYKGKDKGIPEDRITVGMKYNPSK